MRAILTANAGLVFGGLMTFIMMGAGQSLYGPALPAFARDFSITTGTAGLLISAHWVGAAIGVAVMFLRGDQISPRMVLGTMAVGAALVGAGLGWPVTLAAAVIFGAGYGGSTVIWNRRFLRVFGPRGPSMLALLNAIFGIGAIGAPLVFVWIGSDPQLAYLGVAALAVVTFIGTGRGEATVVSPTETGRFVPRPAILIFGALAIGMEACLIGLGPVALIALGTTEAQAAEALSMFFVAFLLARLALVGFASAIAPFTLFMLAVGGAGILAALAAITGAPWLFVPMGAVAALFFPGFYMTGVAQMGEDARVAPTLIAAGLAGGIASPVLLGAVMVRAGDTAFFPVIALVALCTAGAAFGLVRRMNRVVAP
jgi:MFS transporter, FHS family, glucose/mannose:H+ symporter